MFEIFIWKSTVHLYFVTNYSRDKDKYTNTVAHSCRHEAWSSDSYLCAWDEVLSLGGSWYFVALIDEACRLLKAIDIWKKGKEAEFFKCNICWDEGQLETLMNIIVSNRQKDHLRGSRDLQIYEIDISTSAKYSPQENECAKLVNYTLLNWSLCSSWLTLAKFRF